MFIYNQVVLISTLLANMHADNLEHAKRAKREAFPSPPATGTFSYEERLHPVKARIDFGSNRLGRQLPEEDWYK